MDHHSRSHALLSASGSKRWLECTPSALLEDKLPDRTSSFAEEGTLAHEFADIGLQKFNKDITASRYKKLHSNLCKNELYKSEMDEYVDVYLDYITDVFKGLRKSRKQPELIIEQKVDLSEFVPESWGSNDAAIIALDKKLRIYDLKYGLGVTVYAQENTQLMLYALGIISEYELFHDIESVELVIIQPRKHHISTWEISVLELKKWAKEVVIPTAKLAFEGKGVQKAGSWCKFCKLKPRCATLASYSLSLEKFKFGAPHSLTDEQLEEVMGKVGPVKDWISSIEDYMSSEALSGKKWDNYKLIQGRSKRVFANTEDVITALEEAEYLPEDIYKDKELKSLTDLEKMMGKPTFEEVISEYVIKNPGKPKLVHNSAPGKPWSPADEAFDDDFFDEENADDLL